MIILIPIGGIGQRFKNDKFEKPKALIKIKEKEIIFHLLDNLNITSDISYIYIPYNKEYVEYNFEKLIKTKYPHYKFKFLILEKQTRGAAETISVALNHIISNNIRYPINLEQMKKMFDMPILCLDSDNFYEIDIINLWGGKNCIFSFYSKTDDAKFSYIIEDQNNNIISIIEKEKISNKACCGAYGFNSYYELLKYCDKIIQNDIRQKEEFYTSGVIKEMITDNIEFKNKSIDNKYYFSLGTPRQLKEFEYTFLLDLDGTLVNTDPIYIKVWDKILKEYNLSCDDDFFHSFIKGKSDVDFMSYLSSSIGTNELKNISLQKDNYFIEFLKKEKNIMYNGVLDFFDNIQNSKIAIVTSCNKKAASYILKHYNLEKYINGLVASEDVKQHKPHPTPYLKSSILMETDINKCIVFEDSQSGYMSALNSNPYKICLYNNGTNHFIKKLDVYNFNDYKNIDLHLLLNTINYNIENKDIETIKKTMNYLPIKRIIKNKDSNMKTGYICDINKYDVIFFDDEIKSIIVKISNDDNELSKVAKKLNMYTNEIYFYDKLSGIINVNLPKYFGSYKLNNRKSFIMDDLTRKNGHFNIDLNGNISLLLSLVEQIFNMHNKFYFTNDNEIINSMKNLKKINEISYYKQLINDRFEIFLNKNEKLLSIEEKNILKKIYSNFDNIINEASNFPLSFCHGDFKSPNIFYENDKIPYFLDWQYIHLNKGISDIVFLMVESLDFDEKTSNLVLNYYFKLMSEKRNDISFDILKKDFKNALCIFPFFVMVWFNSENQDKLIDKTFPIKFMRNVLKYYNYYL